MALLRYSRGYGDPGIFSFLGKAVKGIAKVAGGALGLGSQQVKLDVGKLGSALGLTSQSPVMKAVGGAVDAWGRSITGPTWSGGRSGGFGPARKRRKGITAVELRGYRKVANLIHKEGMVSRRARGRK